MNRRSKYSALALLVIALVGIAIGLTMNETDAVAGPQRVASQSDPQTLLFVQTKPAGAEVRLEGKVVGESDGLFPVKPGDYKIVIDLEGHQPREQQITIRKGRIARIELTLDKVGAPASATPDVGPANERLANDNLLTEPQRLFRDTTKKFMAPVLDATDAKNMDGAEQERREAEWIRQLSTLPGRARIPAINSLVEIDSSKATAALLKVAADRAEADNRDRWIATRALGLIGNRSAIPDLVQLTYHYNLNTRFWAQISLVRLTGQNFGKDVDAWSEWWKQQGGTPAIAEETIGWTKNPEWADPAKQEETDQSFVEQAKSRLQGTGPMPSGPPRVVATNPASGATDVDPGLQYVTVVFDRDMSGGYSFTGGGPNYPTIPDGKGPVWKDKRTCVLPVELKKAHYYRVGINSTSFQNFRSAAGVPVPPSAIQFTTRGASEELINQVRIPKIVSITPTNGAQDVDPNVSEICVQFNMPMGGGFSWTGGGPKFPEIPDGKSPSWSQDGKACTLPVRLQPGSEYSLGLNSFSHKNFQSKWGVPLDPVSYSFRTKPGRAKPGRTSSRTRVPEIVSITPANGAADVDASVREIRVTFNQPMAAGFSWTGGGPKFPEIPQGKKPSWSRDGKTCTLPVRLKPNWEYSLGLNSVSFKNFKSRSGVPLEPVAYSFRTKAK